MAQIIGDTTTIGTTWQDRQSNGTIGRMLDKDSDGYLHLSWMNGLNQYAQERHIYYNCIDPEGTQTYPGVGVQVDASDRSGYVNLALRSDNIPMFAFHQQFDPSNYFHAAVGWQTFPYSSTFGVYELPILYCWGYEHETVWPKIAIDRDDQIHVVITRPSLT